MNLQSKKYIRPGRVRRELRRIERENKGIFNFFRRWKLKREALNKYSK